jgi:cellulose synthase/poly-beta-1,6-N-acetylglucosamine synthase-like glycosyltransferase
MDSPLISVLLPVKNAVATVEAAIDSILKQTERRFELLLIDDGSYDGSDAVLYAAQQTDTRVRIIHGPARGIATALQVGLLAARGRFIARMDADDECSELRFAQSLQFLESHPHLAGLGTQVEIFRSDQPVSPNMKLYQHWLNSLVTPELLFRDRLIDSPLCHPSTFLRREALDVVNGWRNSPYPEDWDLWLRMLRHNLRLTCLNQVLFRWRDSPARLTRVDARCRFDAIAELKAEAASEAVGETAALIVGATDLGRRLCRLLQQRGHTVRAFVDVNPKKIGQRIHGCPVLAPEALPKPDGLHALVCIGAKGARTEIRAYFERHCWSEGKHFTCLS